VARIPPAPSEFPGTGVNGNGINENIKTQEQWLRLMKTDSCESCHQIGSKGTREIPALFNSLPTSVAKWERRIQSGQAGTAMTGGINALGTRRALAMFADWTDRIAAGEVPPAPPRPQGIERNVVITQWDWADPKAYLHDEIATDRRNPTLNANGRIYGAAEISADYLPVLDPVTHTAHRVPVPVRDPNTPYAAPMQGFQASAYWGSEAIWTSKGNVHNPMFDQKGRVWFTTRIRGNDNPDAAFLPELTHREALERGLKVMDSTALSLCMDNALPIHVFGLDDERNIGRVVRGERIGTIISTGREEEE